MLIIAMRLSEYFRAEKMRICRKERVGIKRALHKREIERISQRQCLRIELCAADDEYFSPLFLRGARDRIVKRVNDDAPLRNIRRIARNNDVQTTGKRATDGFICFATHDHRMAGRDFFEALEIFLNVPQELVPLSDRAICCCDRTDDTDTWLVHGKHFRQQPAL